MVDSAFSGLLTGLSLIAAIGAQNAYLLRQGLRRSHVGPVVAVCALSDFILILAGVSGIGAIVSHAGWALVAVRWLGAAFLTWYGLTSAWRARRPATGLGAAAPGRLAAGSGRRAGVRAQAVRAQAVRAQAVRDAAPVTGSAAPWCAGRWR